MKFRFSALLVLSLLSFNALASKGSHQRLVPPIEDSHRFCNLILTGLEMGQFNQPHIAPVIRDIMLYSSATLRREYVGLLDSISAMVDTNFELRKNISESANILLAHLHQTAESEGISNRSQAQFEEGRYVFITHQGGDLQRATTDFLESDASVQGAKRVLFASPLFPVEHPELLLQSDQIEFSFGGEIETAEPLLQSPRIVDFMGGYAELCLSNTVKAVLTNAMEQDLSHPLVFRFHTGLIYVQSPLGVGTITLQDNVGLLIQRFNNAGRVHRIPAISSLLGSFVIRDNLKLIDTTMVETKAGYEIRYLYENQYGDAIEFQFLGSSRLVVGSSE